MKDINQSTEIEKKEKKIPWGALIVPVIIIIILAVFAGIIYYAKFVKPKSDIDKEIGYRTEDYIELGKYTGFNHEITQQDFDECVKEETDSYEGVERAAKETDQIEFDCTGYVDGKKDKNITQTNMEVTIGESEDGIFTQFEKAMIGHKEGDKITVKVKDATELSQDGSDYSGKNVTFTIKIVAVNGYVSEKVTDKWVKENYSEDYGLETTSDFYQWCKEYLKEDAQVELWQKVLAEAEMNGYPQELYDDVVTEFTQNSNYYADMFGMTTEEYMDFYGYTDEVLEEEYLNEVKSDLVMWTIVKEQRLDTTDEEIEDKYEEVYADMSYETMDEMKQEYSKDDIRKAVLLDKVQAYIYEHSNIKESFKIPE